MGFTPDALPSLSERIYIVTGGNAGIGKYSVLHAARGATVYMGARSEAKATEAIGELKQKNANANVHYLYMDLIDFDSVNEAVKTFKATASPGTIHIVNLTSNGHNFAPSAGINFDDTDLEKKGGVWSRYGTSKLANILHAKELNRQYGPSAQGEEIWTVAVHPGSIDTELNAKTDGSLGFLHPVLKCLSLYKTADGGSYGSLFAAAGEGFKEEDSGAYFVPIAKRDKESKKAKDEELARELWK